MVQTALERLAALFKAFGQRAVQNAEPVAVSQHFVVGIDHGHRVFQIENGGQRRFHHDVGHASSIGGANAVRFVNLDIKVQAIVLQQDAGGRCGAALEADELLGVFEAYFAAIFERNDQFAGRNTIKFAIRM